MDYDSKYWDEKYYENNTGWDIGGVSAPLKEYISQLDNRDIIILIPGAGNAYEAEFMHENGFNNVYVIEWSQKAVMNFLERSPGFSKDKIFIEDFFEHKGSYDLIIEQTFFSSISPSKRPDYAKKIFELLKPTGKLVGLLFDDTLNTDKPPFGGTKKEYKKYFKPYFKFKVFETAYNSIKPRAGRELFINLVKK